MNANRCATGVSCAFNPTPSARPIGEYLRLMRHGCMSSTAICCVYFHGVFGFELKRSVDLFALVINRSFIDWTAQGCANVPTLLRQLIDGHLTLPMGFPGVLVCSRMHTEAVCVFR